MPELFSLKVSITPLKYWRSRPNFTDGRYSSNNSALVSVLLFFFEFIQVMDVSVRIYITLSHIYSYQVDQDIIYVYALFCSRQHG